MNALKNINSEQDLWKQKEDYIKVLVSTPRNCSPVLRNGEFKLPSLAEQYSAENEPKGIG